MEPNNPDAGKKCEGPAILALSTINGEIVDNFIQAVALYCAHKENRFKNIATWMIISLSSFKEIAFKTKKVLKSMTLHIKDPVMILRWDG
jgi:hypothetical protein